MARQNKSGMAHQLGIDIMETDNMTNKLKHKTLYFITLIWCVMYSPLLACAEQSATPLQLSACQDIDHNLSSSYKAKLEEMIAKELSVNKVDILQYLKKDSWSVIYINTYVSDESFLFIKGDPLTNQYIALWSGAASANEQHSIKDWALKNVPNISDSLANCFAWYATHNRVLP